MNGTTCTDRNYWIDRVEVEGKESVLVSAPVTVCLGETETGVQNNFKINIMTGLQRICKMYGGMKMKDKDGNTVEWLWDYVNDKPRLKSEMTKDEIKASEKAKWQQLIKNK